MAQNWAAPLFAKFLGRQWRNKQKDDQVCTEICTEFV